MVKEFITGATPDGLVFGKAINKPIMIKFSQIDEDFVIKDTEGKELGKGKAGDYLIVGKYDSLHVGAKKQTESQFNLDMDETYKLHRYIGSQVNREGAISLATEIDELMRGNWFTSAKLSKKAKEGKDSIDHKLYLLEIFGLIKISENTKKQTIYQIAITNKERKELLQQQRKLLQIQIDYLDKELGGIDGRSDNQSNSSAEAESKEQ